MSNVEFLIPQIISNNNLFSKYYSFTTNSINNKIVIRYKPSSIKQYKYLVYISEKENNFSKALLDFSNKYYLKVEYNIPKDKALLKTLILECDNFTWPSYVFTDAIDFWI